MVKNLPAMWETWVRSLGWEDALEEDIATRSSILAWRIPWTERFGGLQSMGSQRVRHNWVTKHIILQHATISKGFPCGSAGKESTCNAEDLGSIPGLGRSPGEGEGYPLQYSWGCKQSDMTQQLNWTDRWKDSLLLSKNFSYPEHHISQSAKQMRS